MSWKKEAKEITQSHYGGYCEMCRKLEIEPVPYHNFDFDEYDKIKKQFKCIK